MIFFKYILVIVVGYLLGSIPFGLLVSKWAGKGDIRDTGSGKTGATNVLRALGKKAAAAVLTLDFAKGALSVIFATFVFKTTYLYWGDSFWLLTTGAQVLAASAAVAGHTWPIFIKFRGGRGVATFFGGLMALCPPAAIFGTEVLILGAGLTKYMSVGSIAGVVGTYAVLAPLTILHGFPIEYLTYALLGSLFIILMHRDNISRLLAGTERKLGEKIHHLRKSVKP